MNSVLIDPFDIWNVNWSPLDFNSFSWIIKPTSLETIKDEFAHLKKFKVSINVEGYNPSTLKVYANDKYLIITGKEENESRGVYSCTQFEKRYTLPDSCTYFIDKLYAFVADNVLIAEIPCDELVEDDMHMLEMGIRSESMSELKKSRANKSPLIRSTAPHKSSIRPTSTAETASRMETKANIRENVTYSPEYFAGHISSLTFDEPANKSKPYYYVSEPPQPPQPQQAMTYTYQTTIPYSSGEYRSTEGATSQYIQPSQTQKYATPMRYTTEETVQMNAKANAQFQPVKADKQGVKFSHAPVPVTQPITASTVQTESKVNREMHSPTARAKSSDMRKLMSKFTEPTSASQSTKMKAQMIFPDVTRNSFHSPADNNVGGSTLHVSPRGYKENNEHFVTPREEHHALILKSISPLAKIEERRAPAIATVTSQYLEKESEKQGDEISNQPNEGIRKTSVELQPETFVLKLQAKRPSGDETAMKESSAEPRSSDQDISRAPKQSTDDLGPALDTLSPKIEPGFKFSHPYEEIEEVDFELKFMSSSFVPEIIDDGKEKKLRLTLNLQGVEPNRLQLFLKNNELTTQIETIDRNGEKKVLTKKIAIPQEYDIEKLSSVLTNSGDLQVEVPFL